MHSKYGKRIIAIAITFILLFPMALNTVKASDVYTNEAKIYRFLTNNLGFNKAAACGVLSNICYESFFDPCASGDKGTSFGLCQWHAGRYDRLKKFCKENNYNYKTVEGQLYYLKYELETSYTKVLNHMKYNITNNAKGAYDAGYYWCYNFEIPGDRAYCSVERGQAARYTYWEKYKSVDGNNDTDGIFDGFIESDTDTGNNGPIIIDWVDMPLLGDVNCDKKVNMKDVTALQLLIANVNDINSISKLSMINSDINADNELNLYDVVYIQQHIAGIRLKVL